MSKASKPDRPIKVFFSYSHKDEDLRNELEKHLSFLEQKGVIDKWHDRKISAGIEWKLEIDIHLNTADVILLLISSNFFDSHSCFKEMNRAMERHKAGQARVIPIILRAYDWKNTPLGKFQALPTDGKPVTSWPNLDEAFTNVAEGIRKAVEELFGRKAYKTTSHSKTPKTIWKIIITVTLATIIPVIAYFTHFGDGPTHEAIVEKADLPSLSEVMKKLIPITDADSLKAKLDYYQNRGELTYDHDKSHYGDANNLYIFILGRGKIDSIFYYTDAKYVSLISSKTYSELPEEIKDNKQYWILEHE